VHQGSIIILPQVPKSLSISVPIKHQNGPNNTSSNNQSLRWQSRIQDQRE